MAHSFAARAERAARPVESDSALDALAERAARASIVLIGEASHGTQDFYAMRAALTRRLQCLVRKGDILHGLGFCRSAFFFIRSRRIAPLAI